MGRSEIKKNSIVGSTPKPRTFGRVIDGDGWGLKKSEKQKQYEDDHGFNPHRPNGTKRKRTEIFSKVKLGKLDNSPAVKRGKKFLDDLINPDPDRTPRKY